jgi:hypothetical protein
VEKQELKGLICVRNLGEARELKRIIHAVSSHQEARANGIQNSPIITLLRYKWDIKNISIYPDYLVNAMLDGSPDIFHLLLFQISDQ